jgi:hypothetical protein
VAAASVAGFIAFHTLTYWFGWRLLGRAGTLERALWLAGVHAIAYLGGGGAMIWLARRFPLTRERWPVVLAGNLLAVLAGIVLYTALRVATWKQTTVNLPVWIDLIFLTNVGWMFPIYSLFLCAGHASVYFARERDAEVRRNRLRAELANARLEAVQLQLQPELLFSAFHRIAALMHTDAAAADQLLLRVAALLRATLQRVGAPLVPLRDEAAALEAFLDVAGATGAPSLAVMLRLPPEMDAALVPPGVLQRLAGVAGGLLGDGRDAAGVEISAAWSAAYLEIVAAFPRTGSALRRSGSGDLEQLRGDLEEIYGGDMALAVDSHGASTGLWLRVPLLTSLPAAAAAAPTVAQARTGA